MAGCPSPTCTDLLAQVQAAAKISAVPADITPSLANMAKDLRLPGGGDCSQRIDPSHSERGPCIYTNRPGAPMLVLLGDSQAWMWAYSISKVAKNIGYNFGLAFQPGCRMPLVTFPPTAEMTDDKCRDWKTKAIDWVNQQNPAAVLFASGYHIANVSDGDYTSGYVDVIKKVQAPDRKVFVMSDVPYPSQDPVRCLAANPSSALKCATPAAKAIQPNLLQLALDAATQTGAGYISMTPFLCTAETCPAIIGRYGVYENTYHLTSTYAEVLAPMIQQALGLPAP
jgi:hypothetical protein